MTVGWKGTLLVGTVVGRREINIGRDVRLGGNSSRTVPGTTNGISSSRSPNKY